jgi:uncharacterized membrane protein
MIRQHVPIEALRGERHFRWRGGEITRIEGLTDAVFAVALTLLVVSLEVPKDYAGLIASFHQIPAFAVCFAVLVMIWYYHFQFHRRYGLENIVTVFFNSLLLFLILIYVYPLKFLFSGIFAGGVVDADGPTLMVLYSGGVVGIFLTFVAMYAYAWRHRAVLELNELELLLTKSAIREHLIHVSVGVASIAIALLAPSLLALSGLIYFLIGPLQFLNGWLSGRSIRTAAARCSTSAAAERGSPAASVRS